MISVKKRWLIISLCIISCVCLLYKWYKKSILSVKTEIAQCSVVEDFIETEGFVVRDESILPNAGSGKVVYRLGNGEKVAKGGVIADIYSNSQDALLDYKLNRVDKELNMLNDLYRTDILDLKKADILDEEINNEISKLRANLTKNKYSDVFGSRDKFVRLMSEKKMSMGKGENLIDRINLLNNAKKELTKSLSGSKKEVCSPSAGCFVNFLDGYESSVTYESVKNLDISDFDVENIPCKQSLECMGKLINSGDWYLLCRISNDSATRIKSGNDCEITISSISTNSMPCKIYGIKDIGENEKLLVLCCRFMDERLLHFRKGPIKIKINEYYGYKLKKSAVCYRDSVDDSGEKSSVIGVNVKYGNIISFRRVNVIYSDSDYVVVSEGTNDNGNIPYLKNGDNVIVEGTNLYDGKFIKC